MLAILAKKLTIFWDFEVASQKRELNHFLQFDNQRAYHVMISWYCASNWFLKKFKALFWGPLKSENGHFWPILAKIGGVLKIAMFDFFEKQKKASFYFLEISWMNVCLPRTDLRGLRTENVSDILTRYLILMIVTSLRYVTLFFQNSVTAMLVSI